MGRPSRIDRRQILNAALGICDDLGLQAVTMPLVAERLGVTAMALYRHIADKNALLDGLIEVLLSEIAAPDPAARCGPPPFSRLCAAAGASSRDRACTGGA